VSLKKIGWWALVFFVGWYIFTDPHAAAATAHTIGGVFTSAAHSASTFLSGLSG